MSLRVREDDGECRGDLLARAQRGPLSSAEQLALRAHLTSCESCRVIRQVASDFAGAHAVERGDHARLEQMSELARRAAGGSSLPTPGARRRRAPLAARIAAVAAGLILLVGSASAAVWLWPRVAHRAPAKTAVALVESPGAPANRAGAREARAQMAAPVSEPADAPPISAVPAVPAQAPAIQMARVHVPVGARAAKGTPESAAGLLRDARAAASGGQAARAIVLYRRLQKDFPASSEARVAGVPLGRVLLERAAPRAALAEFTRYLATAPGGVLVPEALYGRAQALSRLGDRKAEAATWQRLTSDFPDSPYSALARRRLSELP